MFGAVDNVIISAQDMRFIPFSISLWKVTSQLTLLIADLADVTDLKPLLEYGERHI